MTTNRHASDVETRRPGEARPPAPAPVPSQRRHHAAAFVDAAVALTATGRDGQDGRRLSTAAGHALVRLAELGAAAALGEALRPDPAEDRVTYTVACYQIGDLVPCNLRDLRDPAEAVLALAACPEEHHVAAELLASTPSGLRWSALTRTGDEVRYRPPDDETTSGASPSLVADALERWSARLGRWARRAEDEAAGAGLLGEAAAGAGQEGGDVQAVLSQLLAVVHALEGHLSSQDELLGQLHGRLAVLEQRLAHIEQRTGSPGARADAGGAPW